MNEGDPAGGQLGRSPALPAVADRRSNVNLSSQTTGSAASSTQMSRMTNDRVPQQHLQSASLSARSAQQNIHQNISANNNNNNNNNSNNILITTNNTINNSGGSSVGSGGRTQNIVQNNSLLNNTNNVYNTYSTTDNQNTTIIKKRIKLNEGVNSNNDDLSALKKRILDHKYLRLKSVKEKYLENVAEYFFLQTGNNMMEYPVWRKKPPNPSFQIFLKQHKLEQSGQDENDSTSKMITQQQTLSIVTNATLPVGAEIKIPGVGVTPVAVSTTLPAAVAQLSQQGHIPGRPQGGRHGMVFGQIPVSSGLGNPSVPLVPGGTPIVPDSPGNASSADKRRLCVTTNATNTTNTNCSNTSGGTGNGVNNTTSGGNGSQEQFSVKAKQEVYVMQRVSELQREGLWTERRLPKVQEPQRPKAHWDYLLEEMVWLAADFAQERKWKKSAAKKCARMVQKYFQDKALSVQKEQKAKELQLKRIAAFVAKEIKIFWSNVEKLVEFKQQTKLEEKRKEALDQHLSFIVDQTEKFSQQLTEGMNKPIGETNPSAAPSLNSSRISSPKLKNVSDDEFSPGNESSDDDEETIAKAEAEATEVNEEVAALQRESEMDLDDFLKELPKDYLQNRDKIVLSEAEQSDQSGDEEFKANESSSDDEDTIMEQEKKEKNQDHKREIAELNADNEMSIEELIAKYKGSPKKESEKMDIDSDDDVEDEDENSSTADEDDYNEIDSDDDISESEMMEEPYSNEISELEHKDEFDLSSLLEDSEKKSINSNQQNDKDDILNDAAAIAESLQPKGNTLSSTNVVTPVPFLLKHSLREYQHIGLDWLVTMHERKLNGILADEMGLGKTIQTIALLAHLACVQNNWGPHLIIVPSSVMLNWEMELKKWCPGFKILTYYGSQKERKLKRTGWTKVNAFHVCITSYKLVIQDHQAFRRKKWKYLILDEAQNIKNFKSQRWQLLLNFQTEQRLLLTGTPLQNNLMELWSLMHFLMPHVFQSHREFKEWFSNPMTGMIEGNSEYNDSIIKRLHKVLRPFLLRRLKSEVEKQMPKKYEHVVMCRLSKRQRYLYDDFMSRAKTRETLAGGNLMSVINVLMQLRKVCNHPNLFEVRPTISPFRMEGISHKTASLVCNLLDHDPFEHINLHSINLLLIKLEFCITAYVAHRAKKLATPRKLIEEIDSLPEPPPNCPSGRLKLHVRVKDSRVQESLTSQSMVKVGTSPVMIAQGDKFIPASNLVRNCVNKPNDVPTISNSLTLATFTSTPNQSPCISLKRKPEIGQRINVPTSGGQIAQIVQMSSGRHVLLTPANSGTTTVVTQSGHRLTVVKNINHHGLQTQNLIAKPFMKVSNFIPTTNSSGSTLVAIQQNPIPQNIAVALAHQLKSSSTSNQNHLPAIKQEDELQKRLESEFLIAEKEQKRKEQRMAKLHFMSKLNHRKCEASPIYGSDLRNSMNQMMHPVETFDYTTWSSRSFINCWQSMMKRDNWSLSTAIKTIEERTREMASIFNNFVFFVPAVSAPMPNLHISHPHPSVLNREIQREKIIRTELSPKLILLHPIISAMNTLFPDPRLIQYDCGKLQTLNRLLRKLKTEGHRVLIFTQMTRMLDVLEAFLNYHGHIYLRLDGTTKIEQRQMLMERFNGDKRVFVFILSTRSGGVGVNLTGADTVIFYDSDWNPTMDAQAQDRCHRIGQTRDVHIYRLVSEKTVEENILKKANQKRLLGDMAIEGGNFTSAYFKSSTIQDLFSVDGIEENASTRLAEVLDRDRDRRSRLQENLSVSGSDDRANIGIFESALAAAEDEQDVQATTTAKAEAAADLDEFDENIPLEDTENCTKPLPELSKAEQEVENLIKQLSPIERYAMRFVEATGGSWTAEQLKAAEAEIEKRKRAWEVNRLTLQKEEEEAKLVEEEENDLLTFSREDAKNQIWISENTMENMPMWCPPTPPQDDNDIYIDYSISFLYETRDIIPESQLPPVYIKKDYKRSRSDAGFYTDGARRPLKIRKEDNYYPPRSLFDRPSPTLAKLRRDLKMQRYRGIFKPAIQIPSAKQIIPAKPLVEPEGMAEWFIYEDMAILSVVQNLQALPLNLMLLSPGHTPNWDLVADIVNQTSRTYRSPKQCRYRYEAVIVPREEGKLLESPKKQKKSKNPLKNVSPLKGVRAMRTSQLYVSDSNNSFSKLMKLKFENVRTSSAKKAPHVKQILVNPSMKNPKHTAALTEFGITSYDNPPNPADIAGRRIERLKEKQKISASTPTTTLPSMTVPNDLPGPPPQLLQPQPQQQQQQQQTQQQHQQQQTQIHTVTQPQIQQQHQQTIARLSSPQQPQTCSIVMQPNNQTVNVNVVNSCGNVTSVTGLVQSGQVQTRTVPVVSLTQQQQQAATQLVKAIAASSAAGTLQQITLTQSQSQLMQQHQQQQANLGASPTVSVVLTTPVSTLSSIPHSGHLLSIQQQPTVVSSNSGSGVTQVTHATSPLVQAITTQSVPQVVSVSQIATVGTVITTSSLPPNATVTTLSGGLRGQRIVAAPGTMQEVVLRSGSQSPTVVSVSGLGQSMTQTQLQAQLRLQMSSGQQVSGVVTKGIPVGTVTSTSKSSPIQFYRQQAGRQQLKLLHASPGQNTGATIVQTSGGQTTLLGPSGTIIQGGIVQAGQTVQMQQGGQKLSVATVSGATGVSGQGVLTNVGSVQARTQFIKQVNSKQTITRQVTDSDVQTFMVKRPLTNQQQQQQHKQIVPQAQIFAPANVQQAGTSGQQIATLVKASSGGVQTGTVGMTLSQVKGGQIKATLANQNQVRQLQLQQQIAIAQQRKGGKLTQITQVGGKTAIPAQLIMQNSKNLPPGTVTVQQIQQVMRHAQPGTISTTGQIVLGKPGVGRVIPVSVSQPNARQTIQVVTATSAAQALAAGNLRTAHVSSGQSIVSTLQGTIKVAAAGSTAQQQQALINALNQRQNPSPVRLQTTSSGSLVAVAVQAAPQQTVSTSTAGNTVVNNAVVTTNLLEQQVQQQQQTNIVVQQQQVNQMQSQVMQQHQQQPQQSIVDGEI